MAEELQAEVERLRAEVENYRQRELAEVRSQLADAIRERNHYQQEAHRNADLGRQIYSEQQAEITRLRAELDVQQQTQRNLRNAHAGRN